MKKVFAQSIAVFLALTTTALAADGSPFARAPYLQLATRDSIYVVWRTPAAIAPVVRFGVSPDALTQTVPVADIIARVSAGPDPKKPGALDPVFANLPKLHSAPAGLMQYEAKITGLKPGTRYFYAVYDGAKRLTAADGTYHFATHPPIGPAKPTRVWVVGDSGTGRETQAGVHTAMINWTAKEKRPIDLYLHVGDMAYSSGRDAEFQNRFFQMYHPTLRNTVCWPSMGNHEGKTSKGTTGIGPYYDAYVCPTRGEAGGLPSGMESFYSFDYANIHFICLNSHDLDRKPTGPMALWLKADLEKAKADWIVAFWHHPPYTKGSHDSDKEKQLVEMRSHIMPILESGGVDLVLTGHSHIYERSMLVDGAYATPTVAENVILDDGDGDPAGDGAYKKSAGLHPNEGAVQIVAGHGGTGLKRKGTMPIMRQTILEHGSVLVDVDGDTMTGIMINKFSERRDVFSIVKRGKVTPKRIAKPWRPPAWKSTTTTTEESAEPPDDFIVAIARNAEWQYLAGTHPEGDAWTKLGFEAKGWKVGKAGFGYGDKDDITVLDDMEKNYSVVYIRREFNVEQADYLSEIGIMINYDDAFIAYLNGKEVLRKGVGKGHGKDATGIKAHNAGRFSYYPLAGFEKHLKEGANVLSIEGHNENVGSSDFTLDPYLIIED